MRLFEGIDSVGMIIIIIAGVVLLLIGFISLGLNRSIYKFLKKESERMEKKPHQSTLLKQVSDKYRQAKKTMKGDINLPSFVDEFIASYKINNKKRGMVWCLKLIQMAPATAILIGVLGTFIGLIISIESLDGGINNTEIISVLSGIHTAFYTSIAGILISLAINFMLRIQNSEHLIVQVMLKMENKLIEGEKTSLEIQMVKSLGDVKASVDQIGITFMGFAEATTKFEQATANMNSFNGMFEKNTESLSRLFARIEDHTQVLQKNMGGIVGEFQRLNQFLEKQTNSHEASVSYFGSITSAFKEFVNQQSGIQKDQTERLQLIGDQIEKVAKQSGEKQVAMELFHEKQLEKLTELFQAQQTFETRSNVLLERVSNVSEHMKQVLSSLQENNLAAPIESLQLILMDMNSQFGSMFGRFEQLMQTQDKYKQFYEDVDKRIQQREQQFGENLLLLTQSMAAIKEQNGEMGQLFESTQKYHAQFTENSEGLAEEMKRTIKNTEYIFEATNTMMKEQLVNLHEKMNEFVTLSNDNMNSLMDKMDYSLGDNLKPIMESLKVYMNVSNEIIDKKLDALLKTKSIQSGIEVYNLQALEHAVNNLEASFTKVVEDKNNQAALSL